MSTWSTALPVFESVRTSGGPLLSLPPKTWWTFVLASAGAGAAISDRAAAAASRGTRRTGIRYSFRGRRADATSSPARGFEDCAYSAGEVRPEALGEHGADVLAVLEDGSAADDGEAARAVAHE